MLWLTSSEKENMLLQQPTDSSISSGGICEDWGSNDQIKTLIAGLRKKWR
jgi:hypothetical protein